MFISEAIAKRIKLSHIDNSLNDECQCIVVGSMLSSYLNDIAASMPHISFYKYGGDWSVDRSKTSCNIFMIKDFNNLSISHVQFILCVDRSDSLHVASQLSNQYQVPVIAIDSVSDETYIKRPITYLISNRINARPQYNVSIWNSSKRDGELGMAIPYIRKEMLNSDEAKKGSLRIDTTIPQQVSDILLGAIDIDDNVLHLCENPDQDSEVFISGVIGISENVIENIRQKKIVFIPSCKEVKKTFKDSIDSFVYEDLVDLQQKIAYLASNYDEVKSAFYENLAKLYSRLTVNKQVFTNSWSSTIHKIIKGE